LIELDMHVCTIPTEEPESDGTAEWDSTTIVIVEARTGDSVGIGYTYCEAAAADLIRSKLACLVQEDVRASWLAMNSAVRNAGRPGVASCAISAVDQALWDLKARTNGSRTSSAVGRPTASRV
jgi:L-alanine-DL-glutamate epimerase-like enolase superfamily enzyme